MKKSLRVLALTMAVTLTVSLGLAGCGGQAPSNTDQPSSGASATPDANDNSELHIAVNAVPETFDLTNTTATIGSTIALGSIYECLVALGADYSIVPELAQSFTISDDATEYVYTLRQGVLFHNGQEMKAADVVASMNRWIEAFGTAKTMIGEARFEADGDYAVKLKMDHPLLYLNELITTAAQRPIIVPKSVIDSGDPTTGIIKDYIGTGPYKFTEWAADRYVLFTRNENYAPYGTEGQVNGWSGYKVAATAKVYYDIVPDDSTRVAGIQSGEYDIAYNMPVDNYDLFNGKDDYTVYNQLDGDLVMIYNKQEGLGANAKFRQAVNAALNADDILLAAYANPDFFKSGSSYMPVAESDWYTEEGAAFYNQNSAEASKALQAEAGYNGETFRLLVSSDYSDFYNAAVVIKQQLESAGIKTELVVTDWATYLNYSKDPTQFDAFITSFSVKAVPTLILYLSATWNGWATDPVIVDALANINTATDKAQAVEIWKMLQKYCWEEGMPVSKIGNKYVYSVAGSHVKNLIYFQGPHAWNVVADN